MTIAKNQNTFAKRQREQEKKFKAQEKRNKRVDRKNNPTPIAETPIDSVDEDNELGTATPNEDDSSTD